MKAGLGFVTAVAVLSLILPILISNTVDAEVENGSTMGAAVQIPYDWVKKELNLREIVSREAKNNLIVDTDLTVDFDALLDTMRSKIASKIEDKNPDVVDVDYLKITLNLSGDIEFENTNQPRFETIIPAEKTPKSLTRGVEVRTFDRLVAFLTSLNPLTPSKKKTDKGEKAKVTDAGAEMGATPSIEEREPVWEAEVSPGARLPSGETALDAKALLESMEKVPSPIEPPKIILPPHRQVRISVDGVRAKLTITGEGTSEILNVTNKDVSFTYTATIELSAESTMDISPTFNPVPFVSKIEIVEDSLSVNASGILGVKPLKGILKDKIREKVDKKVGDALSDMEAQMAKLLKIPDDVETFDLEEKLAGGKKLKGMDLTPADFLALLGAEFEVNMEAPGGESLTTVLTTRFHPKDEGNAIVGRVIFPRTRCVYKKTPSYLPMPGQSHEEEQIPGRQEGGSAGTIGSSISTSLQGGLLIPVWEAEGIEPVNEGLEGESCADIINSSRMWEPGADKFLVSAYQGEDPAQYLSASFSDKKSYEFVNRWTSIGNVDTMDEEYRESQPVRSMGHVYYCDIRIIDLPRYAIIQLKAIGELPDRLGAAHPGKRTFNDNYILMDEIILDYKARLLSTIYNFTIGAPGPKTVKGCPPIRGKFPVEIDDGKGGGFDDIESGARGDVRVGPFDSARTGAVDPMMELGDPIYFNPAIP